jgi:hypothetical protein
MLSPPPAQEIRPSGHGRRSVQGGEEIGIIDRALCTASLRKLNTRKPISIVECAASVQEEKMHEPWHLQGSSS